MTSLTEKQKTLLNQLLEECGGDVKGSLRGTPWGVRSCSKIMP